MLPGHQQDATAVAFLSPARAASASKDGTVKLWDLEAGKLERQLCKKREENGLADQINIDLTYAVCFNLAHARGWSVDLTVIGRCRRGSALRRRGVRPGDALFVTGTLGAATLARLRADAQG